MPRLAILEGYSSPFGGHGKKRKHKKARKTKHQAKFAKAAKACKGTGKRFHGCVRSKLRSMK